MSKRDKRIKTDSQVTLKKSGKTINGRLINLSKQGFAVLASMEAVAKHGLYQGAVFKIDCQ